MKSIAEFVTEKAKRDKIELALEYHVSPSCVVWIGDNKYIIVTGEKEIRI